LKSISTLIEDVYGLFSKKNAIDQPTADAFGKRLSDVIVSRVQEQRSGGTLRLSNLGSACDRKLWLSIHSPDTAEPLSPVTRFKFLYGDILEEVVLFLAKVAGHTVTSEQKTVSVSGVVGHIDAIVDGHLIDVKSASPFSFAKFKNHGLVDDDPFAYRVQLGSYLHANQDDPNLVDKDVASFLAVDKTLGHMVLDTHAKTDVDYPALAEAKKAMLEGPVPDRPFTGKAEGVSKTAPEGNGNLSLETICSYCDHKFECW
jgi:hypothetical protein